MTPVSEAVERVRAELDTFFSDAGPKDFAADLRAILAAMQPGQRDKPHCQSCGGEIQGWTCQGCGLTFRENEAGRLVAEPLPAPPGVGG
jgi:hypothetical protein